HAHADGRRIVVAGLGPRAETTAETLRRAAAAAVRRARDLGARTVAAEVLGDRLTARLRAQAVVEGAILGTYYFDRYKREKVDKTVTELRIVEPDARRARDAAGLGIMRALPTLKPAIEVHGLIAATENMPSGSAIRPGDVLRAMNGTTIEIGNTDAEGRLTLADGLCYANTHVQPDEIIDMATLTGACVIALGQLCSGLLANN